MLRRPVPIRLAFVAGQLVLSAATGSPVALWFAAMAAALGGLATLVMRGAL